MTISLRRHRLIRLVYVTTLLAVWIHLQESAVGCRFFGRLSRCFRGSGPPRSENSGFRSSGKTSESDVQRLHRYLMYSRVMFSLISGGEEGTPDTEEVESGLRAVRHFLPPKEVLPVPASEQEHQEIRPSPDPCDVFPRNQPRVMHSAVRNSYVGFVSTRHNDRCIVAREDGASFDLEMPTVYDEQSAEWSAPAGLLTKIQSLPRLLDIFGVSTLREIQSRFSVMVPQDILIDTSQDHCLPFPRGRFLNFVVLYKQTVSPIWLVATNIDDKARRCLQIRHLADAAKLSLAIQVLKIFARFALRGVIMNRADIVDLRIDTNGKVLIQPYAQLQKEGLGVTPASGGQESARCGPTPADRHANARHMTLLLVYIWCPEPARAAFFDGGDLTQQKVLDALQDPKCLPVPEEVHRIIRAIWENDQDASQIMLSTHYVDLYNRLRGITTEEGAHA